jgi:hypothetical protein
MKALAISAYEALSVRSRHSTGTEAFRARGLDMPNVSMKTLSVHLRTNLLATGQFITAFPHSVLEPLCPSIRTEGVAVGIACPAVACRDRDAAAPNLNAGSRALH